MTTTNGNGRWLGVLHARFDALEKTAERRLKEGRAAYDALRKHWDSSVANSHLKRLAVVSHQRLNELVSKSETAGAGVLRDIERLQDATLRSMGFATRGQMAELTREVKRLVRKAGRVSA